ncbi:MAG TPA: DUF1080 domain-containing protein, partial [Verrucomicrobiales bacterium]|nr:DUF1080 domain-containing protein [Verrucomicrobiales bacterium]
MIRTIFSLFLLALVLACHPELLAQEAVSPTKVVNLLADPEFKEFTMNLNPTTSLTTKREEIWSINEAGLLHDSGKGMGYLRTNQAYKDYHLVLDYQWGERTHGSRADKARDCGLLLHAYGPDGAFGTTWMSSIEAQLIEGGSGDILVLAAKQGDGPPAPTRVTAEVKRDRDDEPVWT